MTPYIVGTCTWIFISVYPLEIDTVSHCHCSHLAFVFFFLSVMRMSYFSDVPALFSLLFVPYRVHHLPYNTRCTLIEYYNTESKGGICRRLLINPWGSVSH